MEKQDITLSASRIKTLETCSWTYWANYHLKLPQKNNSGAMRGTICHLVFELLLSPKHKKHFKSIMKSGNIEASPAITRLVDKHVKKDKLNEEDREMIGNMILVGLNQDFFGEKGKLGAAEQEFLIQSENPKYKVRGFIDKNVYYKDSDTVKIVDYKSSKAKFKGDELTANVQAMTYSLASFKNLFPKAKKVIAEFIFLRFPKQPIQQIEIPKEQLAGFEHYLGYVYEKANNFTEKDAKSNYAADNEGSKWLCKAGKTWRCPYLDPFEYFVLLDETGKILSSSFKDDLKAKDKQKIEKRAYSGCPGHSRTKAKTDNFSFDDF